MPTQASHQAGDRAADSSWKTSADRRSSRRRWTPWLVLIGVALAAFLLYRTLSGYSLDDLIASVRAVPLQRLLAAGGFAAASYLCLTGFDYLALRYVGHRLPYRRVALASFTSLSIGHNLGFAALSSGAVRYRFYTRWGLSTGEVAKVIVFCGVTVGLGLAVLGGVALLVQPTLAGRITGFGSTLVLVFGLVCLAAPLAYLGVAATVRRPFSFRGWEVETPPLRIALLQVAVGTTNFACVAACLHQALAVMAEVGYLETAAAYVIANVTALITHVPGGLGVIESVVIFILPGENLIGALLIFRFIYFLVPLALGGTLFLLSEGVFRWRDRAG